MDLLDLLKLMFRRWYIATPVVLLTLVAALVFGTSVQPEYKTSAAILLVPPTVAASTAEAGADGQPGNPWLRVGESAMAQAVQISVSAYDARSRIAAAGGDPDYEVELVNRSSILTVDVSADSEAEALTTVTAVTKLINDEVVGQQASYPTRPGAQISTKVLDPGLKITPSRSNVLRAQIVVTALGLLVAAGAAVSVDAIARHRANARLTGRRAGRRADSDRPIGQASVEQPTQDGRPTDATPTTQHGDQATDDAATTVVGRADAERRPSPTLVPRRPGRTTPTDETVMLTAARPSGEDQCE